MIINEIKQILENNGLNVSCKLGCFPDKPDGINRAVITPMSDDLDLYADDMPHVEISGVRIGIYIKGDYRPFVKQITKDLLENDFTITDRSFIEYEKETKYNHYNIDVEKDYSF